MKKIAIISSLISLCLSLPLLLSFFINIYINNSIYIIFYTFILIALLILLLIVTVLLLIKKNKLLKNLIVVIFMSFLVFCIVFATVIALPDSVLNGLPKGSNYQKFDSSIWIASDYLRGDRNRQYMLKDLIENNLQGKTRDEIKQLLGKPDKEEKTYISYATGPERSFFSVDYELLIILFNVNNTFERYEIRQG
ncbi:hypothetical protein [Endomicrobium proavitum]|uniref:Lipoprotein SmpA/OmlA domain-containing protein n=1 Tax=Endomicrobium proavitum TaxID=1408281 RepID=A0A0G3WGS0_9BACT|nr:hypothetical protein [Endomicrobium proavitum]AKL97871.1 membrane protein of unknown function [Endomicrobium proavitum]